MLWTLFACIAAVVIYVPSSFLDEEKVPRIPWFVNMMFGSFHRILWALPLCWVIIACIHGQSGKLFVY